ncbi:hypothetical protein N5079_19200 [Planotetraspora sp. A-T 1434]|uniref:hypothetical protein n=1 Tax=Planotetraspora sp. A-T 1434 TaxID=2979219 RepID=UPI0021C14B80|nr:hypothetical protein [Planotetraspora sp. A-T 1434]MCT9932333.1 hypothetical protein [Planotetraspora sp. A-T 1434]
MGFFGFRMDGHFALRRSEIRDVSLAVHDMSWLRIRPGRVPFGMAAPAALGYVSPGFEGGYDHLDLRAAGVALNPDVKLRVRVGRKVGQDAFSDTLRLGPVTSLELRRYDGRLRPIGAQQSVKIGGAQLACLTIGTRPGLAAAPRSGSITLRGADGPQMVSLLAPGGGQVPGYAVDLLSQFMSPFKGADLEVSGASPGPC